MFIDWSWSHDGGVSCPNGLSVTFAGAQRGQIEWSSFETCPGGKYAPPGCADRADQTSRIGGRTVKFAPGNYMSDAWMCLPGRDGTGRLIEVFMTFSNSLSAAAAMRLVGSARPA